MNDIIQRLAAMNEDQLRSCLTGIVGALHRHKPDECYRILRDWNLEDTIEEMETKLPIGIEYKDTDEGREYEDYKLPNGLIIRGTSNCAIVVSPGLLQNQEIHSESGDDIDEDDDCFMKCYKWAKDR